MKFARVEMNLGVVFDTPRSFFINPNADGPGAPHIFYHCPRDRGLCGVPLKKPNRLGYVWSWNGSLDAPTLSPSIDCREANGGCGWHGFVRDGDWSP